MRQQAPILDITGLKTWFFTSDGIVKAVDGVDLAVGKGEVLGLVGESGCGKSTLGRGILGLLPEGAASDGEVIYGGRNLVGMGAKELRRLRGPDLGLIFQEPMTRLNPLMRIEDHFRETLEQHEPNLSDREVRTRSLETLGRMGIPPTRFRQYPHEFSGGMRQRIMIALALVLRPRLLVADEPTTSLDVIVEAQILGILSDLRRNFGTALLLITHNLGIVAEACDRVAVMYAGQIAEEGGFSKATLTGVLGTLEGKGLLERSRSTTDGRLVLVSMTPAGRELMQSLFPEFNQHEQQVAESAGDDRERLAELLRHVTASIEARR